MKIEEKHNPNPDSHETSKSWSELPQNLLISMFERLGFADFQQAKSVCSSWHSASRQSVPKNQIHWLVLFPEHNNNSCCTLFNPEEKDKFYKTRDPWFEEFSNSVCIATYGSWLLMQDPRYNLHIVNLFTKEMINLPPWEKGTIRCSVFWIDEKTKDYVVLFGRFSRRGKLDVVYCSSKKGDNDNLLWKQIPETSNCIHLVYKDHKLYYLSLLGSFKIFDFLESIPKEIFEGGAIVDRFGIGLVQLQPNNRLCLAATQLVVNVSGEIVFKVEKFVRPMSRTWSFRVFLIYSSGYLKKHELIDSLGDEVILLDEGITVLSAADNEGFIRNSIYFSDCSENNKYHNFFRFDLETKKTEPLHEFDSSSLQFSRARWFLPSFTHT